MLRSACGAAARDSPGLFPAPRVIVLITFDLGEYVFRALKARASGFLLEDTRPRQLVDALRVVAAGEAMSSPSITGRLIQQYAGIGRALYLSEATVRAYVSRLPTELDATNRVQVAIPAHDAGLLHDRLPGPDRSPDHRTRNEERMTLHVRPAAPEDVPAAAAVLADAFTDYAWTRWTVAADRHAERLTALHSLFLTEVALPFGWVDLGDTGEAIVSVAVWMPNTELPDDVWARVGSAAADLAGDRTAAAAEAEAALAGRRPVGPHVTLASLGVLTRHQGRGVGAATLAPGLARADRDRLPARLETSAEPNVRFYRRLGFTVTGVVDLPDGGPRTWLMRREPCTASPGTAAAAAAPVEDPEGLIR